MLLTNATQRHKSQYRIEQNLVSMEFHLARTTGINVIKQVGVFFKLRIGFQAAPPITVLCVANVSSNNSQLYKEY